MTDAETVTDDHRPIVEGDTYRQGLNTHDWDLDGMQMSLGYCFKCGQPWPCRTELLRIVAQYEAAITWSQHA